MNLSKFGQICLLVYVLNECYFCLSTTQQMQNIMKPTDEIFRKIQEEINRRGGKLDSLEEINKLTRQVMDNHNEQPHPDFEGLSPSQMYFIVNDPVSEQIISFRDSIDPEVVSELPMVRAARIILSYVDQVKGLNLTVTGKLPRKVVNEIHSTGLFRSPYEDILPSKALNEDDFVPAGLGHILLKLAGFIRTAKNKMMLTRKGHSAMQDPVELFKGIYRIFVYQFNKAYFDHYENEEIGHVGFNFVIYLLFKYGDKMRSSDFYAIKYFKAFPMLPVLTARYSNPNENCFEVRVFIRGLWLFGLAERKATRKEGHIYEYDYQRTEAFEKVFQLSLG